MASDRPSWAIMFKNLRTSTKLFILWCVFIVSIGVATYSLVAEKKIAIDFARKELVGTEYIAAVRAVFAAILTDRSSPAPIGQPRTSADNRSSPDNSPSADELVGALDAAQSTAGAVLQTAALEQALVATLRELRSSKADGPSLDALVADAITKARRLAVRIGDDFEPHARSGPRHILRAGYRGRKAAVVPRSPRRGAGVASRGCRSSRCRPRRPHRHAGRPAPVDHGRDRNQSRRGLSRERRWKAEAGRRGKLRPDDFRGEFISRPREVDHSRRPGDDGRCALPRSCLRKRRAKRDRCLDGFAFGARPSAPATDRCPAGQASAQPPVHRLGHLSEHVHRIHDVLAHRASAAATREAGEDGARDQGLQSAHRHQQP